MSYACELWCKSTEIPCIERVQLRYLKYILGVKDSTCTPAVYGETGRFPIHLNHCIKLIKYWCRLISYKDDSLLKKAFNVMKSLQMAGYNTWLGRVEEILTRYDFKEYWIVGHVNDVDLFIKQFTTKVYDKYVNDWKECFLKFPVLRNYICFKHCFSMEKYLLNIKDKKLRKVMSKFRLSSHNLSIEKGRHTHPKLPIDKRICKHCDSVEDEEHLLLHCKLYQEERIRLFGNILTLEHVE